METIYWLGICVVFLVIEIATMGLTTIWFAGGALLAFVVSMLGLGLGVQIAVFIVVSFVLLLCTRPFAVKILNTRKVKTNVDSLVGQTGVVTEAIDNLAAAGMVTLNGQAWTARSENDREKIAKGAKVTVCAISGVKLIVREQQAPGADLSAKR